MFMHHAPWRIIRLLPFAFNIYVSNYSWFINGEICENKTIIEFLLTELIFQTATLNQYISLSK